MNVIQYFIVVSAVFRTNIVLIVFALLFFNLYGAIPTTPETTPNSSPADASPTILKESSNQTSQTKTETKPAVQDSSTVSQKPGVTTQQPVAQQKDVKLGKDYRKIMAERQQKVRAQQQRMQQAHRQSVAARAAGATGPVPQQSIQQYYQGQQDAKIVQQYGASSPQSVSALQAQDYAGVQTSTPKKEPLKKTAAKTTATTKQSTDQKTAQSKQPGVVQQNATNVQKQAPDQKQKAFKGRLPAQRMQRKAWRPKVRKRVAQSAVVKSATAPTSKAPAAPTPTGIKPLKAVPTS